jgi:AraC family transcriptional regulator
MAACLADTRLSFNLSGTAGSSCEWVSAGRRVRHSAEPGAIYLSPPGMDFEASTDVDAQILSVLIPADLISLALGDLGLSAGCIVERVAVPDRQLFAIATALRRGLTHGQPNGALFWSELSGALALNVLQRHVSQPAALPAGLLPKSSIRKINDLIGDSMDEQITLDDLATAAGYGRFRFLRAFTKTIGMTPSRYVMHRRVQAAVSMTKDSRDSFASIAYATGFADQSHLARWCKQVYGFRLSDIRPQRSSAKVSLC